MNRFCTHCGSEVDENAVVCMKCGCIISKDKSLANAESKGRSSLLLGILGIVFAWIFALVGHVVSIIGIVRGITEYKKTGKITGLVLSIVGEGCSIISSLVAVVAFLENFDLWI